MATAKLAIHGDPFTYVRFYRDSICSFEMNDCSCISYALVVECRHS